MSVLHHTAAERWMTTFWIGVVDRERRTREFGSSPFMGGGGLLIAPEMKRERGGVMMFHRRLLNAFLFICDLSI